MAAIKKSSKVSKEEVILITEKNRKHTVIKGRLVYVCEDFDKKNLQIVGKFDIRPRIKKGWRKFGSNEFFCKEDELRSEYIDSFKTVLDQGIKAKKLYINPKNRLIKYE